MRYRIIVIILWISASMMAANPNDAATHHCLLYPSTNQHGDSLTLSGLISVPSHSARGIILVTHYTITARDESPSVNITDDAAPLQEDYVLIVPDYIGYGITADSIHPYLHGPLTAQNCVDMLLHSEPTLDSLGVTLPLDSIYIMGFSQGGATALWTLRLIEEQYADRFHVIRCMAGDGPYDVAATYDDAVERNRVALPIVIPMLVLGTNAAYDLNIDRSLYFTKHMERTYTRYMESKQHGIFYLFFRTLNHHLSHWLTPEAMDKTHPVGKALYEALQRSSLVLADQCPSWTPVSQLYIFHSTNDDVVTFRCAEHLRRCYPDLPNITYDFDRYGNHLYAAKHFFARVKELLNNDRP